MGFPRRLLVITHNPERASFRQRIGNYVEFLKASDIHCDVAVLPSGLASRHRLYRRARAYDGVFLHKKGLNVIEARMLRAYSRRIVYNFDDAVMFSDKRPEQYSRSHFVPFRRSVSISDCVIVGSEYLADQARPYGRPVHVLPIGLATREYALSHVQKKDERIRLVWVGSDSTVPYLEEVRPVLEAIGRSHANVVLRVISDSKTIHCDSMTVEQCRWTAQTRCRDIAGCDIGLAPLPDNPFTRGKCSFKVLEYSAAGLPVIASPVGTNQMYVREGETGYLAEGRDGWMTKLRLLVENPDLRQALGAKGREYAGCYDVAVVGAKLHDLLERQLA